MNTNHRQSPHDPLTPDDLQGIEAALDRLARAERNPSDSGFEQRLATATRGALRAGDAPRSLRFPASWPLRLAAVLALVTGVGLAVNAWRAGVSGPSVNPSAPQGPIARQAQPKPTTEAESPVDPESLRAELDALVSSYEAVEEADLADAGPIADTFWGSGQSYSEEDPTR